MKKAVEMLVTGPFEIARMAGATRGTRLPATARRVIGRRRRDAARRKGEPEQVRGGEKEERAQLRGEEREKEEGFRRGKVERGEEREREERGEQSGRNPL